MPAYLRGGHVLHHGRRKSHFNPVTSEVEINRAEPIATETVLWKRDISEWQNHLWPLKSGPTQLSRRLVSTDKVVYTTLDINAPLTALDAATGETLVTYEGSDATEEIIHTGGMLFLVVRKGRRGTS